MRKMAFIGPSDMPTTEEVIEVFEDFLKSWDWEPANTTFRNTYLGYTDLIRRLKVSGGTSWAGD